MSDDFEEILSVTAILRERALDKHRRNLSESRRLAEELNEIDALRHSAQGDPETLQARRALGADTLWQGWVLQRRADILRQSAMARAREAESLGRARLAFARHEAASELSANAAAAKREKGLKSAADRMDELIVQRFFEG